MGNCKIHNLKTWPSYFERIVTGRKKFEARRDDRDFKIGDFLNLQEYDPNRDIYTGREITVKVTDIVHGGKFGIESGHCAMSIEKV